MVSIITPAYNASKTIKKAIKSVLAQTCTDFEYIIVDDGSTDTTYTICQEFASIDERIKVIHQENKGIVRARIEGLKNAKGEYIFFLDADDWISSSSLKDLLDGTQKGSADVVVAHGYRTPKKLTFLRWKFRCFYGKPCILLEKQLETYHNIYIPSVYTNNVCGRLYRRKLFDHIIKDDFTPLNIHFGDDRYFNFLVSPSIKSISLVNRHLYYYRHGGSVKGYNPRLWEDYLKLFNFQIEYAQKYNPPYIHFMLGQRDRVFQQHITNMIIAKIPKEEILSLIGQTIHSDDAGASSIYNNINSSISWKMKAKHFLLKYI